MRARVCLCMCASMWEKGLSDAKLWVGLFGFSCIYQGLHYLGDIKLTGSQ